MGPEGRVEALQCRRHGAHAGGGEGSGREALHPHQHRVRAVARASICATSTRPIRSRRTRPIRTPRRRRRRSSWCERPTRRASRPSSCARVSSGARATRRCCPRSRPWPSPGQWMWVDDGRARTSTTHVANLVHAIVLALTKGTRRRGVFHPRRRRAHHAGDDHRHRRGARHHVAGEIHPRLAGRCRSAPLRVSLAHVPAEGRTAADPLLGHDPVARVCAEGRQGARRVELSAGIRSWRMASRACAHERSPPRSSISPLSTMPGFERLYKERIAPCFAPTRQSA